MSEPPGGPKAAAAEAGPRTWVIVVVFIGALVALGVLYYALRDPILVAIGRLSGTSRPRAVALAWGLWAVPLALTLTAATRWPKRAPRGLRVALGSLIGVAWLPAVLLFPTSRGGAAQALAESLVRNAPDVEAAIFAGILAGLLSTIAAGLLFMIVGGLRGNAAAVPCCAAASLLGLGGALLLSGHGPEGLGAKDLFPVAVDRFDGVALRRLAVAQASTCDGATTSPRADRTLRDDGCGRLVRALIAPDGSDALVAVSVVAMPSQGRAEDAVEHLRRQSFSPSPLVVPAGVRPDLTVRTPAGASMLVQFGHPEAYVVIIGAAHGDGRGSADPAPLGRALDQVYNRIVRIVISG